MNARQRQVNPLPQSSLYPQYAVTQFLLLPLLLLLLRLLPWWNHHHHRRRFILWHRMKLQSVLVTFLWEATRGTINSLLRCRRNHRWWVCVGAGDDDNMMIMAIIIPHQQSNQPMLKRSIGKCANGKGRKTDCWWVWYRRVGWWVRRQCSSCCTGMLSSIVYILSKEWQQQNVMREKQKCERGNWNRNCLLCPGRSLFAYKMSHSLWVALYINSRLLHDSMNWIRRSAKVILTKKEEARQTPIVIKQGYCRGLC